MFFIDNKNLPLFVNPGNIYTLRSVLYLEPNNVGSKIVRIGAEALLRTDADFNEFYFGLNPPLWKYIYNYPESFLVQYEKLTKKKKKSLVNYLVDIEAIDPPPSKFVKIIEKYKEIDPKFAKLFEEAIAARIKQGAHY